MKGQEKPSDRARKRPRVAEVGGIRRGGTEGQNTRARADVLRRESIDLTRAMVALACDVCGHGHPTGDC